ncbi:hypothetical protein T10_6044 [Trichinella papuae]|uniref:Uncharacterized protein n=1 Tax=Trichinella papuae TaxID=268474 RepID=A0A0V1M6P1_9BILA|nr:hypothetical protein T10_9091 [Trichinella papuae]KRZ66942.1 hypothetical protein T10_4813 [Trichinella papuae]KRZ73208.1 hypothetical protein T10_6044 [Trichinella papuae]
MLLVTAFFLIPQVDTGVTLLEAGTTVTCQLYFIISGSRDDILSLWNVHSVNIQTTNHLEGWHNQLNKKAG